MPGGCDHSLKHPRLWRRKQYGMYNTCDQNLSRMLPSLLGWFLLRFCLQTSGQAVLFYAHLISIFFHHYRQEKRRQMSCCLIYLGVLPIFLLLIPFCLTAQDIWYCGFWTLTRVKSSYGGLERCLCGSVHSLFIQRI